MSNRPTIATALSPPGMGGVAIIELCGPEAAAIAGLFLDLPAPAQPPTVVLRPWREEDAHVDDVLVIAERARVRICCHGGVRVVERILLGVQRHGAVVEPDAAWSTAWPETTPVERDVLAALPDAPTARVARWLCDQMAALPTAIRDLMADPPPAERDADFERLIATYPTARRLLDGIRVAIAGAPNAGKSTLANRLFDRPWSTAAPEPGTTRDWVNQPIALGGLPIELIDTAGLRDTDDDLEDQAIDRGRTVIEGADVVILVMDAHQPPAPDTRERLLAATRGPVTRIIVHNKCDLLPASSDAAHDGVVSISALTGTGLDSLRDRLIASVTPDGTLPAPAIWTPDQLDALILARKIDPEAAAEHLQAVFLGPPEQTSVQWGPIV